MEKKHLVLIVAHDLAPCNGLDSLPVKIYNETNCVTYFAGGGKPLDMATIAEICAVAERADLVITGMSSSLILAAEELAAGRIVSERIRRALQDGTKPPVLGLFIDTDTVSLRPWFEDVADAVGFVMVPNSNEASLAQGRFPGAEIMVTGSPTEEAAAFPRFTRNEVRRAHHFDHIEKVIIASGGKEFSVNEPFLRDVVRATSDAGVRGTEPLTLIFSPHPGDMNDPKAYLSILNEARECYTILIPSPKHLDSGHPQAGVYDSLLRVGAIGRPFSGPELLPGCDMVIQSALLLGKEAGCLEGGRPVLNYFTQAAFDRNPAIEPWPPVERGVETAVYDRQGLGELTQTILRLLTEEGFAPMKKRQEEIYPLPEYRGAAVDRMAGIVRDVLANIG